jgi:hypothetical protein
MSFSVTAYVKAFKSFRADEFPMPYFADPCHTGVPVVPSWNRICCFQWGLGRGQLEDCGDDQNASG